MKILFQNMEMTEMAELWESIHGGHRDLTSPRYFCTNSDPTTQMKAAVVWVTALASMVLPVPGGPYNKTPGGGWGGGPYQSACRAHGVWEATPLIHESLAFEYHSLQYPVSLPYPTVRIMAATIMIDPDVGWRHLFTKKIQSRQSL